MKAGDKFTAIIYSEETEGKVQIENGVIYLCQDKCDGLPCRDKLGYKYSWKICYVEDFCEDVLFDEEVVDFKLVNDRKSRIEKLKLS